MNQLVIGESVCGTPFPEIHPVDGFLCVSGHLHIHYTLLRAPALHKTQLALHRLIVLLKYGDVTVVDVVFPWYDAHCSSPADTAAAPGMPWSAVGNIARDWILAVGHIPQPFAVEIVRVEVVHDCHAGYLAIAGIRTLFAVGAIAGDSHMQVVGHCSPEQAVDLLQHWVGTREVAGGTDIRINDFCLEVGSLEFSGPPLDDDFIEGIPVERRGVALFADALADVLVISVPAAFYPVLLPFFGRYRVFQHDLCAGFGLDAIEMDASGNIIAEIYLPVAFFILCNAHGIKNFHNPVLEPSLAFESSHRRLPHCLEPVVAALEACIIHLAGVDIIIENWTPANLPAFVRAYGAGASVRIFDLYLANHTGIAERRNPVSPVGCVPTGADSDVQAVLSLAKHSGDIVCEIHYPVIFEGMIVHLDAAVLVSGFTGAIHCLVGHVIVFAYTFAVDGHFEQPQAADVDSCLAYFGLDGDVLPEFRGGMFCFKHIAVPFPWGADPYCLPFFNVVDFSRSLLPAG